MAQIPVANFSGTSVNVELPNANGRVAAASSRPVVLSTEDLAVLNSQLTALQAATPAGSNVIGGVTVASLPLPAGAATAAKQPALGTSGTPSADVLSIQGIAGGIAQSVDTAFRSTATSRSAIIGFTGAVISTTNGSTTITLTTAPTLGTVQLGMQIAATGVPAGATLATLASGTLGVAGSTYTLSAAATATGTGIATTSIGPQQLMAANTSRRGTSYQNQHASASVYINGVGSATADYNSLLLVAGAYLESKDNHTGTGAVAVIASVAGVPLYAREWN